MFVMYGLSKTNPLSFVSFIQEWKRKKKRRLKYLIEPTELTGRNKGKKTLVIFFSVPKMLSFLRKMASKKTCHTILIFGNAEILNECGVTLLDTKRTNFKTILATVRNMPNLFPPNKVPNIKREASIYDLIEKSKTNKSFLQAYYPFFYSFQHSMREGIKLNVLNFMIGKQNEKTFRTKMKAIGPKRGDAVERFQGLIDLALSDIGLLLKKALNEALTKGVNEKVLSKKYEIPAFDIRYFLKSAMADKKSVKDSSTLGPSKSYALRR